MGFKDLLVGTALLAGLGTPGLAQAGTVVIPLASNATSTPIIQYGSGTNGAAGSGAVASSFTLNDYPNPAYAYTESASVAVVPEPTLNVSISGISIQPNNGAASATANSTYYFSVTGPSDIMVPVLVQAKITSTFSAGLTDAGVVGYVTVGSGQSTSNGQTSLNICPSFSNGAICPVSDVALQPAILNQEVDFSSNGLTEVYMSAIIRNGIPSTNPYSGSITVDPLFTIDPTWLAGNPGYSLEFSPGFGDSPAGVPEPATWAMMLVGLGGLGAAMRSRRGKVLAAIV